MTYIPLNPIAKLHERPSYKIYARQDPEQVWKECDCAYEMGYIAAEADLEAGLPPMQAGEHDMLWGAFSDYHEGYDDAVSDRSET